MNLSRGETLTSVLWGTTEDHETKVKIECGN